ncbi:thermonuclease family protein [Indioceanicola profundi]|uniref:thermonuclease family protein n=1 Tax=Indioceanicola profundi TaxID=2220096 RepID=UPI0013C508E7|nr:thermonuclease family protein [Indioceanicola profundi]
MRMWVAAAVLWGIFAAGAAAQDVLTGPAIAVEGDRLTIEGQEIRLYGIDAPDRGQKCVSGRGVEYDCFEMSRLALERLLQAGSPTCTMLPGAKDDGRLARCTVNGHDIGAFQVLAGWAMSYRRIAPDYAKQEALAMSRRRGLWTGRAEAPWIWRDRQIQGGAGL